jgi:hypothetical protein
MSVKVIEYIGKQAIKQKAAVCGFLKYKILKYI